MLIRSSSTRRLEKAVTNPNSVGGEPAANLLSSITHASELCDATPGVLEVSPTKRVCVARYAALALGVLGCGAEADGLSAMPIPFIDTGASPASERNTRLVPSEQELCSLAIGASTYEDAIALLGEPDVELLGSFLSYSFGSGGSIEEGAQLLLLSFDPQERFEAVDTVAMDAPSCWWRGEAEFGRAKKALPVHVEVSPATHQVPSDYAALPDEEVLCRVELDVTTYEEVWFDIFDATPTHLQLGALEAALEYRFHEIRTGAVVSVYFFFSALEWTADLLVDQIVVYNASCAELLAVARIHRIEVAQWPSTLYQKAPHRRARSAR